MLQIMLDSQELQGQPEEKELFIQNVLRELEHDEFRVSCDMLCSRVLDKLFEVASPRHVLRFASGLTEHYSALAKHRYGSHVLQAIMAKVGPSLKFQDNHQDDDDETDASKPKTLSEAFLGICEILLSEFEELINDTYGGHVIASAILTLTGSKSPPPLPP